MVVYVVNELNELNGENYNSCHGVYASKEKAKKARKEVFERAIRDLGYNVSIDHFRAYNDESSIEVNIDEANLEVTPFNMFVENEAEFRLEEYCDEYQELSEEEKEDAVDRLSNAYACEEILDYDFMDNLARDVVRDIISERKEDK